MKIETIKAIFINTLFLSGVILLIVGFAIGLNTAAKSLLLLEYPLDSWDETRCDMDNWSYPLYADSYTDERTVLTAEERERQEVQQQARLERCLEGVERSRKAKQISHSVTSISLIISGIVLIVLFRGYLFSKKNSK